MDRAYPPAEATEAHTYLESHRQTGKVLLLPQLGRRPPARLP
ncbi:hypothetical protein [Streptomyces europaeiscabiei]